MKREKIAKLKEEALKQREDLPREFIDFMEHTDPDTVDTEEFTNKFNEYIAKMGEQLMEMLVEFARAWARDVRTINHADRIAACIRQANS